MVETIPVGYVSPVDVQPRSNKKKKHQSIIKWKDAKLLRAHAPSATVEAMAEALTHEGIIQVNVIGSSFSGKTELCRYMAHDLHNRMEKRGYKFQVIDHKGAELLKIREIAESLDRPTIALFHDVAYVENEMSPAQFKAFLQELFTIRHHAGKICLMLNYHYSRSAVPALRGSTDWLIYTTLSRVDMDRLATDMKWGKRIPKSVKLFFDESQQIKTRQTWRIRKNEYSKPYFVYKRRKPFILSLVLDGNMTKLQATPLRQWVDPHCHICDQAQSGIKKSYLENQEEIFATYERKYGSGNVKTAIRNVASEVGYDAFGRNVSKIIRDIKERTKDASIDWQALFTQYGIKVLGTPEGEADPTNDDGTAIRIKEKKTAIQVPKPKIKKNSKKPPGYAGRANFHAPTPQSGKNGGKQ